MVELRALVRQWWPTALLSLVAFASAFAWRHFTTGPLIAADIRPPSRLAPDSVHLAAMGIRPGRELVAYLFLASRCSHCQRPEFKAALRELRARLRESEGDAYRAVSVVGVLVESNIAEGLSYLTSVGASHFDEVSLGRAWQNEQMLRWAWRERVAQPEVPQVVLVQRELAASYRPFRLRYGRDSVLAAFSGRKAVLEWIGRGATVPAAAMIARGSLPADSAGTTRATTR